MIRFDMKVRSRKGRISALSVVRAGGGGRVRAGRVARCAGIGGGKGRLWGGDACLPARWRRAPHREAEVCRGRFCFHGDELRAAVALPKATIVIGRLDSSWRR